MANHPSALKRQRQNEKRQAINRSSRSAIKNLKKKVLTATKKETATELLAKAVSTLAKAAKNGVIHSNAANRSISRLTRFVKSLQS